MNKNYERIYMSLRNALANEDDNLDDVVYVKFDKTSIALKKEIPSTSLLLVYSMLYYKGWLEEVTITPKPIDNFIGGNNNPHFKLLFKPELAVIAAAIGSYAGIFDLEYSSILGTTLITPRLGNPLVDKTVDLINNQKVGFQEAREVFIELMSDPDIGCLFPLADDYIANAKFIEENHASTGDQNG